MKGTTYFRGIRIFSHMRAANNWQPSEGYSMRTPVLVGLFFLRTLGQTGRFEGLA